MGINKSTEIKFLVQNEVSDLNSVGCDQVTEELIENKVLYHALVGLSQNTSCRFIWPLKYRNLLRKSQLSSLCRDYKVVEDTNSIFSIDDTKRKKISPFKNSSKSSEDDKNTHGLIIDEIICAETVNNRSNQGFGKEVFGKDTIDKKLAIAINVETSMKSRMKSFFKRITSSKNDKMMMEAHYSTENKFQQQHEISNTNSIVNLDHVTKELAENKVLYNAWIGLPQNSHCRFLWHRKYKNTSKKTSFSPLL